MEDRKKSDPSLLADDKDQFAFNGASKKIWIEYKPDDKTASYKLLRNCKRDSFG